MMDASEAPPERRNWLFLNYEFPPIGGGGGTCSKYLAKELARAGQDVEVVTAAFEDLPRLETLDGYRIRRLASLRAMAGQCRPHEMISWVISAFTHLFLRGRGATDFIVSFHSIPSGMPAWPLSMFWNIPHIILFQGGDVPGWLPGELERMHRQTLFLNRWIVNQSAAAIANSDGLRDLAQKSFTGKPIDVLYGGADPVEFAPPSQPRASHGGPIRLLFAGRMTTQKGLDVVLRALGKIRLEHPALAWRLDAAGDGPRRWEFEALAADQGIGDLVTFRGFLHRKQMRTLYDEADLFVFPSRYEGMPNVVLEAMSMGLGIVGTRIAGTEQLVEPGINGELIGVDDLDALAGVLVTLLRNPDRIRAQGEASRRLVLEKWTWAQRARELLGFADRIAAQRRQRGNA